MFENGFSGSLTASLREIETSVPALTTLDDSRQNLIFSLSYPLLKNRGGRTLQYPAQIAGFGKNIAELQYEFLTESEILHTTVAFYQVCLAYEEKKAVLSNIEGAEAVAETMKRRFELGTSEAKDLLRTQAAVSAQKTRLIVVNNGLAKSKINLLKAMGEKDLSQPYECDYDLSTTLSHIDSKTNILFSAITRRKDLQQLEYRIKIADKTIALEEDSKAANLDIITSYATDGLGGNNAFSESETPAWMLGLAYKKKFGGETKVSETIKEKEKLENSIEDYKAMIAEEIFTAVEDVNHLLAALT